MLVGIEDIVALLGENELVARCLVVVFKEGLQAVAERVVEQPFAW